MADNLNIISSRIISNEFDIFWNENISAGESHKTTLVISTSYDAGSQEELQLQKMLQACSLTPASCHIVQLSENSPAAWHQLRDKAQPEFVILLGISTQQLGISALMRFTEPNRFNDCIFIPTLALPELEKQPDVKKQLWLNALKPVFVDKTFQKHQ